MHIFRIFFLGFESEYILIFISHTYSIRTVRDSKAVVVALRNFYPSALGLSLPLWYCKRPCLNELDSFDGARLIHITYTHTMWCFYCRHMLRTFVRKCVSMPQAPMQQTRTNSSAVHPNTHIYACRLCSLFLYCHPRRLPHTDFCKHTHKRAQWDTCHVPAFSMRLPLYVCCVFVSTALVQEIIARCWWWFIDDGLVHSIRGSRIHKTHTHTHAHVDQLD